MKFEDIICANFECGNFYRREKAKMDLQACRGKAMRFVDISDSQHPQSRASTSSRTPIVVSMEVDGYGDKWQFFL